jgi:hypothetical protein
METTKILEWRKKDDRIQYVEIVTQIHTIVHIDIPIVEFETNLVNQEQELANFDAKKYIDEKQAEIDKMRTNIITAKVV